MFRMSMALALFAFSLSALISPAAAQEWARFRGPNGEGKSSVKGMPTKWTMEDYDWVIDLPGVGHSSPILWGKSLFLTTGNGDGTRTVMCLDALTGETIWEDTVALQANHLHKKNSYASGTPACDGKRLYVPFADEQHYTLLAYSLTGERLWSRDLGSFTSQHGQGVSPMIYEGLVIVQDDQKGPSRIFALDAESGDEVWSEGTASRETSYSTPMIININSQDLLVSISGAMGIIGLEPKTGKILWNSGELPLRTVASPIFGEGRLFASCGQAGVGKFMVAVDPKQKGQVTAERTRSLPYVPTPIVHEGHLYLWNDTTSVCCVDLTGDLSENVWSTRMEGNFSGSPVLIDGKIYCVSEEGDVVVIDAKPTFKLYGRSPLGDSSYSTPAVANDRLYLRGFSSLACLKAVGSASGGSSGD